MKCPNCGEKMEREDYEVGIERDGEFADSIRPAGYRPMADYFCESCGSEFRWSRKSGLRVVFDSYGDASCDLRERCALKQLED